MECVFRRAWPVLKRIVIIPSQPFANMANMYSSTMLFAGQGAQTVGMTRKILRINAVKEMYETANDILGYDLLDVIMKGPSSKLDMTVHAQPALLLAGLAAIESLKYSHPDALRNCTGTAGLSLGEYCALVFAGSLTFEDALRVVKVRAEAMQEASQLHPGKMMTVVGMTDDELVAACRAVSAATSQVVQISNYLFPGGRVAGGHPDAIAELKKKLPLLKKDVILKELLVSGAFHTPLMEPAKKALTAVLAATPIAMPRIPVIANTLGRPYASVEEIREQLTEQVIQPVLWQGSLEWILKAHEKSVVFDMGPRGTVKAMLRKINMPAWKTCVTVDLE